MCQLWSEAYCFNVSELWSERKRKHRPSMELCKANGTWSKSVNNFPQSVTSCWTSHDEASSVAILQKRAPTEIAANCFGPAVTASAALVSRRRSRLWVQILALVRELNSRVAMYGQYCNVWWPCPAHSVTETPLRPRKTSTYRRHHVQFNIICSFFSPQLPNG